MRRFCLFLLSVLLLASARLNAQDPTISGTISSTVCPGSGCLQLTNLSGREMATVEVGVGFSGTMVVEITSSWTQVTVYLATTKAASSTITAAGTYLVPMPGASAVRVRGTAVAGSSTVRLSAGSGSAFFALPVGAATETTLAAVHYSFGANAMSPAGQKGTLVGGIDAIAGTFSQLQGRTTTPSGGEFGIVVRNIPSGTQAVSASSLPLPTGAATEATLSTINGKLPSTVASDRTTAAAPFSFRLSDGSSFYNGATDRTTAAAPFSFRLSDGSSFYKATTPSDTQPISAASLPLPTNAATESQLSGFRSDFQTVLSERGTPNSQNHVTIGGMDLSDPGNSADAAFTNTTPGASDMGLVVRNIPSGTQGISAASLPLPSGAATAAAQATLEARISGSTLTAGTLSATTSAAALASSTAISKVLIQSDHGNSVDVLCGSASAQPIRLKPGEGFSMEVTNINLVFCKSESSTATVNYAAR